MIPNKIAEISEEDFNFLLNFSKQHADAYAKIISIMENQRKFFESIYNIDLKGENIGLQTISQIRACDILKQILEVLREPENAISNQKDKKLNPWR